MARVRPIVWMPVLSRMLWTMAPMVANAQGAAATLPGTMKERQELLRRITQQQQAVLQQRTNCINRASNLAELEACERGYPTLSPGWRHGPGMGGWTCPMW